MFSKILVKSLTAKSTKLINYMEKHHITVMNMSISQFSKQMGMYPSFITKTLKKVGYYGWKDWKAFCLKDIITMKATNNYGKYLGQTLFTSISNTINNIDMILVNDIVQKIIQIKEIAFIGNGYSLYIARDQNRRYSTIGYHTRYIDEKTGEIASISKNSVLFIISLSSHTSLTKKQIDYLKNVKKCILIFVSAINVIEKNDNYDYILSGSVIDNVNIIENKIPRHSRMVIYSILDLIFLKLFLKNPDKNNKILELLP